MCSATFDEAIPQLDQKNTPLADPTVIGSGPGSDAEAARVPRGVPPLLHETKLASTAGKSSKGTEPFEPTSC